MSRINIPIFVFENLQNMKYHILLLSILYFSTVQLFAQPKITLDKGVYDFETILWKNPVTATFVVKNTGNKPLVISNVTSSCGCTVVDWEKRPIMPGKKGVVSSVFDAKTLGRFRKSIGIYSNASNMPQYVQIKGTVTSDAKNFFMTHPYKIGDVRLDKNEILFDDANKGDKPFVDLLLANMSEKPYYPVLMHLPPYMSAKAIPERINSNQTGKIRITVDTNKLPGFGLTTASVYLAKFLGDKVGSDNEIPISIIMLPNFNKATDEVKNNPPIIKLSQNSWNVDELKQHKKKSIYVVVSNQGKSNLEIKDLQVFNSALGVELKKKVIAPGSSTKLKITIYSDYLKKTKGMPRLLIISNDPNKPKIIFNVNAIITK